MKFFWESRKRQPSHGSTNATAIVTVKMSGLGAWSYNCQMDQIVEQARDEVLGRIRNYAQKNNEKIEVLDVKIVAVFAPEAGL